MNDLVTIIDDRIQCKLNNKHADGQAADVQSNQI